MITQLPADSTIPQNIVEIAAYCGVGTPVKRHQRNLMIKIYFIVTPVFAIGVAFWLVYLIYGYFAFIPLSQTYPDIFQVPQNQLDNYIGLQLVHNRFWFYLVILILALVSILSHFFSTLRLFRTRIYLCTEGLLLVYKQEKEAIRWDDVTEVHLNNNIVKELVREDGSKMKLPFLLMTGRDQTTTQAILEEIKPYSLTEKSG